MIYVLTWERYHESGNIIGAYTDLRIAVEAMRENGVKEDTIDCTACVMLMAIDGMGKPLKRTLILTPDNQYDRQYHPGKLLGKIVENVNDTEPVDPYTFDFKG